MPNETSVRQQARGRTNPATPRPANHGLDATMAKPNGPKDHGAVATVPRPGAAPQSTRAGDRKVPLGRSKPIPTSPAESQKASPSATRSIFGLPVDQPAALTLDGDTEAVSHQATQRPLATDISVTGDIVIDILDVDGVKKIPFRVETTALKLRSLYFNRLLSNKIFVEGRAVDEIHAQLKEKYGNFECASNEELPHIEVEDVGPISQVKSLVPLLCDFFSILHGKDHAPRKLPLANLANLAIVADRFDCLSTIATWAEAKGHLRPQATPLNEEGHRQRILTGILLGNGSSVAHHSAQLILAGSRNWSSDKTPVKSEAMWWDLPQGIESEVEMRRAAILETLSSLIDYHVETYTSRERKCRLGYDTSPLCDSFQLGEFIKFLVKHNALSVQSCVADSDGYEGTTRDVRDILSALRGCPSYQIDFHSHCGPRKQFVAGIEKFESWLQASLIGVCLECWRTHAAGRSWAEVSPPPIVDAGKLGAPRGTAMLRDGHTCSKTVGPDVFFAKERLWNMPTQPPTASLLGG